MSFFLLFFLFKLRFSKMFQKESLVFVWLMLSCCLIQSTKGESENGDKFLIARGMSPEKPEILGKYIVDIRFYEDHDKYGARHLCMGSIVSRYAVVTSAICVMEIHRPYKILPIHLQIVAGSTSNYEKNEHTRIYKVKQIFVHEKYISKGSTSHEYAVSVLRPIVPIEIITGFTEVIKINPHKVLEGQPDCTLLGWGTLFDGGPFANELIHGTVQIMHKDDCAEYADFREDSMICAAGMDESPYLDTCMRDGGAPIICNGSLYGMGLFGFGCGIGYASIFIDTAAYQFWIGNYTKEVPPYTNV